MMSATGKDYTTMDLFSKTLQCNKTIWPMLITYRIHDDAEVPASPKHHNVTVPPRARRMENSDK